MRKAVKSKSQQAPLQPGVYLFKASRGRVIYVGKAKNLRTRLRSYGQQSEPFNTKREQLLAATTDLEWILVDNEKEALALENNLIKKFQPRYNVLLRDDKTLPLHQIDRKGEVSAGLCDQTPQERWLALLRPLFPSPAGLPYCGPDPPVLPGAFLQGGSDAHPSPPVSRILH